MFSTFFPIFDQTVRTSVEQSLEEFLGKVGKSEYSGSLSYLLNEVIGNSEKANLKRAYFSMQGLDLNNPADYEKGMKDFREAIYARQEELVGLIRSERTFVRVQFLSKNDELVLEVANACPLHPAEQERIQSKLKLARKFNTVQEVMAEGLDQTEGGGFGLIISVLMLRKIGLDENALRYVSTPQGTTVSVVVPLNLINRQKGEIIAQAVLDKVQHIPQFPQNILQILNTLIDPKKTFDDISGVINKDPALIADILKTANSSMYMLPRKIDTIEAAVRIIGVSALRQLVMLTVSQNLLTNVFKLDVVKKEMEHATEVAYYAGELAKLVKDSEVTKNIFLCAMLHDFGKIIINSIQPNLVQTIETLCRAKGLNEFMTETLTNGYNHSIVGAELAKKWNFPDNIVESIQFHHLPLEASEPNKRYVYLTYLANSLSHWAKGEVTLDKLSLPVLRELHLEDLAALEKTFKGLVASFQEKKARGA